MRKSARPTAASDIELPRRCVQPGIRILFREEDCLFRARCIPDNAKSNYRLAEISRWPSVSSAWRALSLTLTALILTATQQATQDVSPPVEDIGALLLIIGCFEDLSQCHELPAPVSIFETTEACDQQLPDSFGAFTGQYEQLYAQCLPVDPAMEDEAELVWEVNPDGTLFASVEVAPPPRIESTGAMVALVGP